MSSAKLAQVFRLHGLWAGKNQPEEVGQPSLYKHINWRSDLKIKSTLWLLPSACFQESQWSWATQLSNLLLLQILSLYSANMAFLIVPINYFFSPLLYQHEKQVLTWNVTNLQKYTNHKTSVLQTAHFIKEVIFLVVFSLVSCNKESNNKQTIDFPEILLISPLCPLTSNTFSLFLCCREHIHTPVCTHTGVYRQTKSILAARKMPCMSLQITEGSNISSWHLTVVVREGVRCHNNFF